MLRRPEVGAAVAALVVFAFFAIYTDTFLSEAGVATWTESSARIGIMAVGVSMLMIGGEFDLSTGTMIGTTGLTVGVLTTHYGVNVWVAVLIALALALVIGALNGILVMRTGLPSFIVTLATFFVLQGLNLALVKAIIGGVAVQGMRDVPYFDSIEPVFATDISLPFGASITISVLWWIAVTAIATWVLLRTKPGNWIFAVGGAATSARQVGVPLFRTKIGLFMTTAFAGWLVGMIDLFSAASVTSAKGVGDEFIFIICAVVGGCLLTGGYGSAIGAALGALIYGMTEKGIVYAGWDSDWLMAFLGVMLLLAVLVNTWVRKQAEVSR
ncbi:ABC transporter permease [Solicola gregarius]|uniref:Xylose transport system permease protein XylH n=1 Tax=Solicola gregarius TaxID=2908642 RepID=A0AA46TJ14_9ACTN|nr:ABC transporter permease [Solicola gregarius]UYM05393.1 ABC transporter permease [Solicola gregarius]